MTTFKQWSDKTIAERREAMVNVTGADPANLTDTAGTQPWEPWSEKVMVLTGASWPAGWLWLACRDCGWYLGYSPQCGLEALATAGRSHAEHCNWPLQEGDPQ